MHTCMRTKTKKARNDEQLHKTTLVLNRRRVKRLPSIQSLVKCERMRPICFELAFYGSRSSSSHSDIRSPFAHSNANVVSFVQHRASLYIEGFLVTNFGYISHGQLTYSRTMMMHLMQGVDLVGLG